MKITQSEVAHVANLARLELDESSVGKLAEEIGNILDYMDKLSEVNTEGINPTSHAIFLTNAFREDVVTTHMDRDLALSNAPDRENGNFVVPKVIED